MVCVTDRLPARSVAVIRSRHAPGARRRVPIRTPTPTVVAPARERTFRPARPHGASEAELAAHAAFLETVKSPLWSN